MVGARMTVEPLLNKLGVTTETLARGERAALLSPTAPLSDDERAALTRELQATYRTFVRVVAEGRKMTIDAVEPLARGRVYTGEDAKAVGLVDVLGGFDVAVKEILAMLPIETRERVEARVIRTPRHEIPILAEPSEDAPKHQAIALLAAALPDPSRTLLGLTAMGERILALSTMNLEG